MLGRQDRHSPAELFLASLRLAVVAAVTVTPCIAVSQTPSRVAPIQHWCSTGWPVPHTSPEAECAWLTMFLNWQRPLTWWERPESKSWYRNGYCLDYGVNPPSGQFIHQPKFCPANHYVKSFIGGRGCGLPGYSDGFEGDNSMYCERYGLDTKKNLGACTAGSQLPSVGNPINTGIYNKFQLEDDFTFGGGAHQRVVGRAYNSAKVSEHGAVYAVPQPVLFGPHWASTFDRRLLNYTYGTNGTTYAVRPDGKVYFFNLSGSQWLPDPDVSDKLTRLVDAGGVHTGWTYIEASTQDAETYDVGGRLVQLRTRAGFTTDLIYDGARLITVRDAFGRELAFAYGTNGLVSSVAGAGVGTFLYRYDTRYNLTEVEHSSGTLRRYHYENTTFKNALTGITDELGVRYSTYGYDTYGSAVLTELAGSVNRWTIAQVGGVL